MTRRFLVSLVAAIALGLSAATADEPVAAAGQSVFTHGMQHYGEPATRDVVAIEVVAAGNGYWVATAAGQVSAHGAAADHGDLAAAPLEEVLGMAAAPAGSGYWLVARDGGVFSFGDARFYGSTGGMTLNAPVVGMATTRTGNGYWLVARDGGVFGFGDARFYGSTGGMTLNAPVVGIAATPTGNGYWVVARDGGVFSFGDAHFHGSTGGMTLNAPVIAIASATGVSGYWLLGRDGGVFTFGSAPFRGSSTAQLAADATAIDISPTATNAYAIAATGPARIMVTGDVHGERQIAEMLARGENPLSETATLFHEADAVAVNLETPAADSGTPERKQYVFRAPPSLLPALESGGVDVVSLANNHALDYGRAALADTMAIARQSNLRVVGAGMDAPDAFAPVILERRAHRVAFVGLSRVVPPGWAAAPGRPGVASAYDERAAMDAVRTAKAVADVVVVLIHWGTEGAPCPDDGVRALASRLHAAGATVVAGHHPHVLQGIATDGDAVTAFSLGNFVWYHNEPPSGTTGVLDVHADRRGVHRFTLRRAEIGDDGRPRLTGATTTSSGCV